VVVSAFLLTPFFTLAGCCGGSTASIIPGCELFTKYEGANDAGFAGWAGSVGAAIVVDGIAKGLCAALVADIVAAVVVVFVLPGIVCGASVPIGGGATDTGCIGVAVVAVVVVTAGPA
jgi:hypothetical protein